LRTFAQTIRVGTDRCMVNEGIPYLIFKFCVIDTVSIVHMVPKTKQLPMVSLLPALGLYFESSLEASLDDMRPYVKKVCIPM